MGEKIEFVYPCRDCTTQEHCIKASLSNNEVIKCIHFGYIEDLCNAVRLSVERKVANDILKTIGVSDISFFFISSFQTLVLINNSKITNHIVGTKNIIDFLNL